MKFMIKIGRNDLAELVSGSKKATDYKRLLNFDYMQEEVPMCQICKIVTLFLDFAEKY